MSRVGLCSVTLRAQTPAEVVALAAKAGLESIEWGSDEHVPAGRIAYAREIGQLTRDAGIAVASYGSYLGFPWEKKAHEEPADVVATAVALGAPRVRLWAGPVGSAEADDPSRRATVAAIAETARLAAGAGLTVATEFHGGTLTDTAESAVALLDAIGESGISTYWQPRVGASDDEALADLDALGPRVSTMHVFSWDDDGSRLRLAERESLWRPAVARATALPSVTDLLLEFVPDDDPALLAAEARVLRGWRDDAVLAAGGRA